VNMLFTDFEQENHGLSDCTPVASLCMLSYSLTDRQVAYAFVIPNYKASEVHQLLIGQSVSYK